MTPSIQNEYFCLILIHRNEGILLDKQLRPNGATFSFPIWNHTHSSAHSHFHAATHSQACEVVSVTSFFLFFFANICRTQLWNVWHCGSVTRCIRKKVWLLDCADNYTRLWQSDATTEWIMEFHKLTWPLLQHCGRFTMILFAREIISSVITEPLLTIIPS